MKSLDYVDEKLLGKAIESIIRIACLNMKDKNAGLYLISELKEKIKQKYISALKSRGVDIDLIQIEQHFLYKQRKIKISLQESYKKIKSKDDASSSFASLINFAWEKVAFWEYQDSVCTIYDKKGHILDRLPLDKIVKDYLLEFTGFDEIPLNSDKIVELNEKEYEFIQLLYSKDLDAEEARKLLNLSSGELSIIIRKFISLRNTSIHLI